MPHAAHNARRVRVSAVGSVPPPKLSRGKKELIMALGVGFTMVVVVGLYAASFNLRPIRMDDVLDDFPRWTAISDEFAFQVRPLRDGMAEVKEKMKGLAAAGQARADGIRRVKEKLSVRSASDTLPTPDP
jgi:hypothetical protein